LILPDVNVLIYAFRPDSQDHSRFKAWLDHVLNGPEIYAISEFVLASFVRLVTNVRIFNEPNSLDEAFAFTTVIRSQPHCALIKPGEAHWKVFVDLCLKSAARGNHVADAYLAALVIESGNELITTDRDFSRYPGLRWRHPLQN